MHNPRARYLTADRPRVEVIPMIDIMMFLLVFFVVISLKMIAGSGIPLDLPAAASAQQLKSSTITVGVTARGEMVIDGSPVSAAALTQRLLLLKQEGPVDVVLAGEREVSLQTLLQVMDGVRAAGINNVGVAAKAEPK